MKFKFDRYDLVVYWEIDFNKRLITTYYMENNKIKYNEKQIDLINFLTDKINSVKLLNGVMPDLYIALEYCTLKLNCAGLMVNINSMKKWNWNKGLELNLSEEK